MVVTHNDEHIARIPLAPASWNVSGAIEAEEEGVCLQMAHTAQVQARSPEARNIELKAGFVRGFRQQPPIVL